MMEYAIIATVAFFTSVLTFFSGFGVGTILTPAFVLFFPVDVAIGMTAIVHFLNNVFKLSLTYRDISKAVLLKFGLPAIPFAMLGAWLLINISGHNTLLASFSLFQIDCNVQLIELVIGILMLFFAITELVPVIKNTTLKNNYLLVGGAVSGFFGGLSGHQGALRTVFLIKSGLSKSAFIATGIAIACIVDVSRMGVYFTKIREGIAADNVGIIATATIAAFAGAYLGKKLLNKVTIGVIQYLVSFLIIVISVLLILGLI